MKIVLKNLTKKFPSRSKTGPQEVIAVNDGSTDTSAEILAEYEKKDARVRVFTKENGGLADARNLGIEHARGEYLAFLDSDDAFSPDFVREMLGKAEREGLDMVLCDLPFGTTQSKWDIPLDTNALWREYERIINGNCAIVLFGAEPFASKMRLSTMAQRFIKRVYLNT